MASYPVPAGESRAEIREKGSRFLAVIGPAADEAAARAALAALLAVHEERLQALREALADLGIESPKPVK